MPGYKGRVSRGCGCLGVRLAEALAICCWLAAATPSFAAPASTTLEATADNYVRENRFGNLSNGGTVSGTGQVIAASDLRVGCGASTILSTSSATCAESFVRFDFPPELLTTLQNSRIEAATFTVELDVQPVDTGETYTLAPVIGSWTETTLNWDNKPGFDLGFGSDFTAPLSDPLVFDVREIVEAWLDGSLPIEGFVFTTGKDTTDVFGMNIDYEAELGSTNTGQPPQLSITYSPLDEFIELVPSADNLVRLEIGGSVEGSPSVMGQTFANFQTTDLQVGCTSSFSGGIGRTACNWSLLKFDVPAIAPGDLVSAALLLSPNNFPTALGDSFFVDAAGASWDPNTVSWADRPNVAAGSTAGVSFAPPTGAPVELDVTDLVAAWADGSVPNEGLIIGNTTDAFSLFPSSQDGVLQFSSTEAIGAGPEDRPLLSICVIPAPSSAAAGTGALVALGALRWRPHRLRRGL